MEKNLKLESSYRGRTARPKIKTGCNNCKQRRIKCDEKRPACANCIRSKKICSGYPPPPRDDIKFGEIKIAAKPLEPVTKGTPAPGNRDSSRDIDNWRYALLHGDHSGPSASSHQEHQEHHGLALRLSAAASELFSQLLVTARSETSKSLFRDLEREYSCLQLWCDGYGTYSGDLDAVLAESRSLRRLTIRLLASICNTLADKITPVWLLSLDGVSRDSLKHRAARTRDFAEAATLAIRDADHAGSDSDDSDDSDSETGSVASSDPQAVKDMIEDLKTDIQCLVALGPRFKEPVRDRSDTEETAVPPQATDWDPAAYLTARIRHRYPGADPAFAQILGQANWDRAQRLYAAREKNAQRTHRLVEEGKSASRPPGTVIESAFHDSGLGTSIPTASYAETVLSYHDTNGSSIRIPPVPVEGRQAKRFECPVCGCMCQLLADRWKTLWKRHVLSDLQPYVCVVTSCNFSKVPFPDKMAWMQHLELEHGFPHEMTCPICRERLSGGSSEKASHLARHLEEFSLMILPANADPEEEEADYDSDFSDVPPPLRDPKPELLVVVEPTPDEYSSDSASDEETSRCSTPSRGPRAEMASPAEPHAETARTAQPFCPHCGKAFRRTRDLEKHVNAKHNRQFKCSHANCERDKLGFPTAEALQRHRTRYPPESPLPRAFECLFKPCPYRSTRESFLKQHMETAHAWVYDRTSGVEYKPNLEMIKEDNLARSSTEKGKKKEDEKGKKKEDEKGKKKEDEKGKKKQDKENSGTESADESDVGEPFRSPVSLALKRLQDRLRDRHLRQTLGLDGEDGGGPGQLSARG